MDRDRGHVLVARGRAIVGPMPRTIDGIAELKTLVGLEVAVSDWFRMTQERIDRFAQLTEDDQWIHIDTERAAKESPYGTTIAHGFLTLSMLSEFSRKSVVIEGNFSRRINYEQGPLSRAGSGGREDSRTLHARRRRGRRRRRPSGVELPR